MKSKNNYSKISTSQLVALAIQTKLAISPTEIDLKAMTDEIKVRADKDKAGQVDTKTGGKSWTRTDEERGISIVVSFPAEKRVALDDTAEVKKIAGKHFDALFAPSYKAVKGFVEEARKLLTPAKAAKLIEAATEENAPRVSFSIKGAS